MSEKNILPNEMAKENPKKRVVVVDDEVPIARMLKIRLEAQGYEVSLAHDGKHGLDLIQSNHPDLVILDIVLPVIDGFKVCRILKFDATYQNIPVIMLTARSAEESKRLGQQMGADAYFTKPFEPDQLLRKIDELIGKFH